MESKHLQHACPQPVPTYRINNPNTMTTLSTPPDMYFKKLDRSWKKRLAAEVAEDGDGLAIGLVLDVLALAEVLDAAIVLLVNVDDFAVVTVLNKG